jgi:hypothetical protein
MNLKEKRAFVRRLTNSIRDAILARVKDLPEEWDGHELRQYLADNFAHEIYRGTMKGRRLRDYRNAVAISGRL